MPHSERHHIHSPETVRSLNAAFIIGISLNAAYVIVETVFGFVYGSMVVEARSQWYISVSTMRQ